MERGRIVLGGITWSYFPDAFPNIHVNVGALASADAWTLIVASRITGLSHVSSLQDALDLRNRPIAFLSALDSPGVAMKGDTKMLVGTPNNCTDDWSRVSMPFPSASACLAAEVLFPQLSVIYTLPRLFPSSFTLLVPYFATGTTEKMHEEGQA
eukprot:scaffold14977_cov22-Tisochrysis_lutea.AAC.1